MKKGLTKEEGYVRMFSAKTARTRNEVQFKEPKKKMESIMKKVLTLLLATVMVLGCFALVGCGGGSETSESQSGGAEVKKLVMATNATFPPYEYMQGTEYKGIDIEIAQAIAAKLGRTLEIANVEFDTIIGGVQTGKYDMGMAGMTVTPKRQESVNFSASYATGIQVVIIREDSEYQDLDDFFNLDEEGNWVSVKEGVKVGVQQGTTGDIYASCPVDEWGFGEENVVKYKNGPDAVAALLQGRISCVIIDNEPAKAYVANNQGLKITETEYANEDYAICVAKENTELLAQIDQALAELTADGTIAAIIEKYIPSDGAAE